MTPGQTLMAKAEHACGSRYALAKRLHVSQGQLSEIANGAEGMAPGLAARLAAVVNSPEADELAQRAILESASIDREAVPVRLMKMGPRSWFSMGSQPISLACPCRAGLYGLRHGTPTGFRPAGNDPSRTSRDRCSVLPAGQHRTRQAEPVTPVAFGLLGTAAGHSAATLRATPVNPRCAMRGLTGVSFFEGSQRCGPSPFTSTNPLPPAPRPARGARKVC